MSHDNLKRETFEEEELLSEKIEAMKKKAMEAGARPVKLNVIDANCCAYWVGCDTIQAQR